MSTNACKTLELQEEAVKPKKKTKRGARGKGATEKHRFVHDSSYRENSAIRRDRDINVRCPKGDSDSFLFTCSVSPFLFTSAKGSRRLEHQQQISEEVEEFYRKHGRCNQLVEVSSGINIANKRGDNEEKGVFSLCPIPDGTRICPYVGEVYQKQPRTGKFIMEISSDVFVDAEHDPYDVGYLYFLDPELSKGLHNPPN